jgi:conjugal transfer/entry exclusion protein
MTRLRLKRHYKLLLLLALVFVGLVVGMGDQPIVAYSVQDTAQVAETVITHGQVLAAPLDAVPDSIQVPGAVQPAGAAGSE